MPAGIDDAWLEKFSSGLRADAEAFACPLFGGDTIRTTGPVTVSIFAFGSVPHGKMVKRSGAKAGDRIIVTGTIGDAALGLRVRKEADAAKNWKLDAAMRDHLLGRYLMPQPRLALAEALQAHASAAMDVSDGLVGDLTKLCGVSGVSAEIDASSVPLSAAAQTALASDAQLIETILTGGDDYEIVCAMKPDASADIPRPRRDGRYRGDRYRRLSLTGRGEPRFIGADGPLSFARKSFSHF